jgi:hypothetical protein
MVSINYRVFLYQKHEYLQYSRNLQHGIVGICNIAGVLGISTGKGGKIEKDRQGKVSPYLSKHTRSPFQSPRFDRKGLPVKRQRRDGYADVGSPRMSESVMFPNAVAGSPFGGSPQAMSPGSPGSTLK